MHCVRLFVPVLCVVFFIPQEPMYYGYLFALGLVSSTLVSAFLTSHFTYQVNY